MAEIVQEGFKLLTGLAQLSRPPHLPATEHKEPVTQLSSAEKQSFLDPRRVTTDETIEYQKRKLAIELSLLEGHLQEGCHINQKPCDCCEKHPMKIEGLALEAAGMSTEPIFKRIATWAFNISPKTTEEAAGSGKYTEEYPRLAIEARDLRKAIMPTPVYIEKEVADGETIRGTEVG